MNYISIHLYRKMIRQALKEGLENDLLAHAPTPPDVIDHINAVPADHFFELHEFLDDKLGPGFALRVGQAMEMEDYGVLGLSWRTCSRAGEIFERCERYFHLLSNTYVFRVSREKDLSHVFLNREAHRRGVERSNEATFSATVVVLRAMTEKDIFPVRVSFQHPPAAPAEDYERIFRCPVLFNQPANSITYTSEALNTQTARADRAIHRFLVERVEEETSGIEIAAGRIAVDVENLIRDALPGGIPAIAEVSRQLGLSTRTLTRRLAENNTTYRDLIRKTQESVARDLLLRTSRSVSEIAFETGFSEQSAFNRAFKRWTGASPVAFRKNKVA